MKKVLLLLVIFLLCGCSNYTELNDLAIINTIGVDKINNKYKVSISVIDTVDYKNDINYNKKVYSAKALSFEEALNNLYLQMDKTIYLSHLENLLISDNLNNSDLKNIMGYFLTNKENRNTFNIILLKDYDIKDILIDKNINLQELLKTNNKNQGVVALLTFEDYLKDNLAKRNVYIPTITYKNKVQVLGYSIYKNNCFKSLLTKNESIIYNIINNNIDSLTLHINSDLTLDVKNFNSFLNVGTLTHLNINSNIGIITNKRNLNDKKLISKYNYYLKKNIYNFNTKYKYLNKYQINLNTNYINNTNIKGYD